MHGSEYLYAGVLGTLIQYNITQDKWQASIRSSKSVSADIVGHRSSYALGTMLWNMKDNSKEPSKYQRNASLSLCGDFEYTCWNGLCIPLSGRCNGMYDCDDKSDEAECNVLQVELGYSKGDFQISICNRTVKSILKLINR